MKLKYKLLTIFALLLAGGYFYLYFNDPMRNYDPGEFFRPEKVGLGLLVGKQGEDVFPFFRLSAVSGASGCDEVSELNAVKKYEDNKMIVTINGYRVKKGEGESCVAVVQEARKDIKIDYAWLEENKEVEIIFESSYTQNLPNDNDMGKYKLSLNESGEVVLKPLLKGSVVSYNFGENISDNPRDLEVRLDERTALPVEFNEEARAEFTKLLELLGGSKIAGIEHTTDSIEENEKYYPEEPTSFEAGRYLVLFEKEDEEIGLIFQTEEMVSHLSKVIPGKSEIGGYVQIIYSPNNNEKEGLVLNNLEVERLIDYVYFRFKQPMTEKDARNYNKLKDYAFAIRFSGEGEKAVDDFDNMMRRFMNK